jgi:hypothetical protein
MGAISPLELRVEPRHGGIHQQPSHDCIKNTIAFGHPLLKQIAAQRPTGRCQQANERQKHGERSAKKKN